MKTWTMEDLETHIKSNLDESYSAAIIVGAYHKVVFGDYPKIGLSGFQASAIDLVAQKIEEMKKEEPTDLNPFYIRYMDDALLRHIKDGNYDTRLTRSELHKNKIKIEILEE